MLKNKNKNKFNSHEFDKYQINLVKILFCPHICTYWLAM